MNAMDNFRTKMKERRELLNLTLKDIAEEIGVKEATVQRYESGNGIKSVPYEKIVSIANVLKCSPAYLMGWEQDSKIEENFSDENMYLTIEIANNKDLKRLISYYNKLNAQGQNKMLEYADDILKSYKKDDE